MTKLQNTFPKPYAATYRDFAASPNDYISIEGVPVEIAARLPGFVDFGMDGDGLVEAVRKAGSGRGVASPEWCQVLMAYGHEAMQQGEKFEEQGNVSHAERAFLDASFWYFFARFPHILTEEGAKAYELHKEAYLRAAELSEYPLESIPISIDGKIGRAYLRFPKTMELQIPAVMISGGVDTWKSELEVHSLSEEFLNQGMATLLIDIPGTGECPIPASESAHSWFLAASEALKLHARIDGTKIGFYGLSFGGYWATKLAFIAPWLSGIVNNGGPVHLTFQQEWVEKLPQGLRLILGRMFNLVSTDGNEGLLEKMESLSLRKYFSAKEYAPLLGINGEEDRVVPIQEMYSLTAQGVKQDTLIFANDRHVASRNWKLHEVFAAQWMSEKFRSDK